MSQGTVYSEAGRYPGSVTGTWNTILDIRYLMKSLQVCLPSLTLLGALLPFSLAGQTPAGVSNSINPLVDSVQAKDELVALNLYGTPEARSAELTVAGEMLTQVRPLRPESYNGFLEALQQLTFAYTVVATDSDPDYPHILHLEAQPHIVANAMIPGTLDLLNNPDVIYRRVLLDGRARYLITGQRAAVAPIDNSFSILDSTSVTVANLSGRDLVTDAYGNFTLTLDSDPGSGEANHLTLPAGTSQLLIRDTLSDQTSQRPNHLEIARVGGPLSPPPRTFDQLRTLVAGSIAEGYAYFAGLNRLVQAAGVNTFAQPVIRTGAGELITQANSIGHIVLDDDEALVLTLRPGGAAYMTVAATNIWQVESDFVHHTTSLNMEQAVANADGSYTFVIATKDPGVYNWIDPVNLHETIVEPRWQGLPSTVLPGGGPAILSQAIVKLSQVGASLPAGTRFVTPVEREEQLRVRAQSFRWRKPTG